MALGIVDPVGLAGISVQAMDKAAEIAHKHQSIGDRGSAEGAMDLIITPHGSRFGNISVLVDISTGEVPASLAMLRILADGHIDPVLIEDGGCDDLAGTVGRGISEWLAVLHPVLRRVAVVAPDLPKQVPTVRC